MAIGEFGLLLASAIVRFKGDTSDLKAKIKDLQGEEKKLAESQLKASEARNKNMESWAKGLAKAAVVTQVATKALSVATDGWKEYEKFAKKAGGTDEERARSFRSSLATWNSGLEKIQVAIGKVVTALGPLVELAGTIVGYAADAIGAVSSIAGSVGGAFTANRVGSGYTGALGNKLRQMSAGATSGYILDSVRAEEMTKMVQALAASGLITASAISTRQYAEGTYGNVKLDPLQQVALNFLRSQGYGGGFAGAEGQVGFRNAFGAMKKPTRTRGSGTTATPVEYDTESRSGGPGYFSMDLGAAGIDTGQFDAINQKFEKLAQDREKKKSLIESIFGPLEEMDLYAEKLGLLGDAVGAFTGALSDGFDAWISGSKTAAEAIKGVFADTIKGIAQSLLAHAIEHGLAAVGSLAFGDVRGAVMHGKAAAGYAAGAVAVGALARQLSGSGASGSAGGYAGSGGGGGGRIGVQDHRGGAGPTNIMVVVGGEGADSPRFRARAIKHGFDLAERYEGQSKTVTYS